MSTVLAPSCSIPLPTPTPARNPAAALRTVADTLKTIGVPWQLTGGIAARYYGSARPLEDLDIDVPDACLAAVTTALVAAGAELAFHPSPSEATERRRCRSLLTLHGQTIDITGHTDLWFRHHESDVFIRNQGLLARAKQAVIDDIAVRVIPLDDLIAYKQVMRRPVDEMDLVALGAW